MVRGRASEPMLLFTVRFDMGNGMREEQRGALIGQREVGVCHLRQIPVQVGTMISLHTLCPQKFDDLEPDRTPSSHDTDVG